MYQNFINAVAADLVLPPSSYAGKCIVANMHTLPTIANLMNVLLSAGIKADNMLFIGKPYSMVAAAQQEICKHGIRFACVPLQFRSGTLIPSHTTLLEKELREFLARHIDKEFLLLDSGGQATQMFDLINPKANRVSVQLTSSGSRKFASNSRSIIDIGASQLKQNTESAAIGSSIVEHIRLIQPALHDQKITVVGYGVIGEAVRQSLLADGIESKYLSGFTHDGAIAPDCDIVIGATGYDLSDFIERSGDPQKQLSLFSCSSWDIEFRRLLTETGTNVDLSEGIKTSTTIRGSNWIVYNGGCPINFNRTDELEIKKPGALAMTRGLTLAAALRPDTFDNHTAHVAALYARHFV